MPLEQNFVCAVFHSSFYSIQSDPVTRFKDSFHKFTEKSRHCDLIDDIITINILIVKKLLLLKTVGGWFKWQNI